MAKKQPEPIQAEVDPAVKDALVIADLIKYNLYLLSKSIVFAAVSQNIKDPIKAAAKANEVIEELDLLTKQRKSQAQ